MRKIIATFTLYTLLATSIFAQTAPVVTNLTGIIDGSLTIENSDITKQLYGRSPIQTGSINICSYVPGTVKLHPQQVYIATADIPSLAATDAQAILTKSFAGTRGQKAMTIIN